MKNGKKLFLILSLVLLLGACGRDENAAGSEGEVLPSLGDGLALRSMDSYAGIFVEDGSDDTVDGVCAITVENTGEKTVQYAHITLTRGEDAWQFDLSTLPPGESAQLLEQDRQSMPEETDGMTASVTNFAVFDSEPSLCEEVFDIKTQDNAITVTNHSDQDVTGPVYVYYKAANGKLYMGGITYRVKFSGLAAGESATGYAGHFAKDSRLMFVTYVP